MRSIEPGISSIQSFAEVVPSEDSKEGVVYIYLFIGTFLSVLHTMAARYVAWSIYI